MLPPQPELLKTVLCDTVQEVSAKSDGSLEFLLTNRCQSPCKVFHAL